MFSVYAVLSVLLLIEAARGIRRARPGRRVFALALALFLWSWPPAAALLCGSLEWRYAVSPFPAGDAEAIVVLGGDVYEADPSQPENSPGHNTSLRCSYAAWLHRRWKPLPILAAGGSGAAAVMARALEADGAPPSMIWTETASGSTYENAVYSARILRAKGIRRIALVTEAYHMPRAAACFRKQGLAVVPAPFAYRTLRFHADWRHAFPSVEAARFSEDSLHEWVGLAWYRLLGRI
jgi:uncharacterized SAM-binding protein YcdF (DUF218 family)